MVKEFLVAVSASVILMGVRKPRLSLSNPLLLIRPICPKTSKSWRQMNLWDARPELRAKPKR